MLTLAVLATAVTGCNTTGCTDNQNSVPLAGFYSISTLEKVAIDSLAISGLGAPNDSLLVGPSHAASEVYLPFRAADNVTTFVIKYMQKHLAEQGIEDRVTFYYESMPFFASEECGAMYHYRITRVSHTMNILDSVGVSDSLITNIERSTIGLYFRIAEPDPDEPGTDEPGTDTPDPDNPENPDPENPDPDKPDPENPDPDKPGTDEPGTDNPDNSGDGSGDTDSPQEGAGNV